MKTTIFERSPPSRSVISESLADSVNRPFWLDDLSPRPAFAALTGDVTTDLVIVGGGFLGLWTAVLAKERDPKRGVILLEANEIGWAASGRNGGFCKTSLTHGEENGHRRWPLEFDRLEELGHQNLDEFEATLRRYGIDCDFERTGVMKVAVESYQVDALTGKHGFLTEMQVRAEVASPTFLAGQLEPVHALLHPGKLAQGLTKLAVELGVHIHEKSAVLDMAESRDGVRLRTAAASVQCAHVVLASNAFPSLLKRYRFHTIPVYDYVLMTEPLDAQQLASVGWANRQGVTHMGNQFHYSRLTRDNRILFGGYDAIYHFGGRISPQYEDRPQTYELLASHFFTTFPQLEGLRFSHRWAGVIDTCSRFCAFFALGMNGKVGHAAGFTGLGVAATRFAANVLLDKLDGLDTERTRLQMVREMPLPFPPEPFAYAAVKATQWALNRADHSEGRRNLLLRTMDAMGLGFDS